MSKKAQPIVYGGSFGPDEEERYNAALTKAKEFLGTLTEEHEASFRDICAFYFQSPRAEITPAGEQRKRASSALKAVEKAWRLIAKGDAAFQGFVENSFQGLQLCGEQVQHPSHLLGTVKRGLERLLDDLPEKGGWESKYGQYEIATNSLVQFWEEVTGKPAEIGHDRSKDVYDGDLFNFVVAVYYELDRAASERTVGREISQCLMGKQSGKK